MNPFTRRSTAAWYSVGLASDLPNLDEDGQRVAPKCKAFTIPTNGPMERVEDIDLPGELKDQVLVFKYKGKYHAIDHVSLIRKPPPNGELTLRSNAPTRPTHCRRGDCLILRTLESFSVRGLRARSMIGLSTYFPAKQTVASIS